MVAEVTAPAKGVIKVSWDALTSGTNDGAVVSIPRYRDKTVQISGSFNTATVELLGSMASSTGSMVTLKDADGANINTTTTGMFLVRDHPQYIMPSIVSTGTGTSVSVDVTLLANG